MKLGLITDIHEHVEHLRAALEYFRRESVEQVVMIGDVFSTGERIEETCRLLAEANAIGVWGNHDFGLCVDVPDDVAARYPRGVIEYMGSLRPKLTLGHCHFAHVEPWLNAEDFADLWYFEGLPDEHRKLGRVFEAVPHSILFAGHYHKWLLATPDGILDWNGEVPVRLANGRYFVVIGAHCEGRLAVFDTESLELVPHEIVTQTNNVGSYYRPPP